MLMVGHLVSAVIAFLMVSPITSLGQALYIAMLISISRRLDTFCMPWLYMALLAFNIFQGVFSVLTFTSGFMAYAAILFFYLIALKKMYTHTFCGRNTGETAAFLKNPKEKLTSAVTQAAT